MEKTPGLTIKHKCNNINHYMPMQKTTLYLPTIFTHFLFNDVIYCTHSKYNGTYAQMGQDMRITQTCETNM